MAETEEAIPADRVVETLETLLRTPPFQRSPKLARFLRFVVEEELAGRGATVKAYTIATQALGRGPDFDASLDPSVRVEAGRLRRVLDDTYAQHPAGLEIRVTVPVGSYRPRFAPIAAAPEAEAVPEPDDIPLPPAPGGGASDRGRRVQPARPGGGHRAARRHPAGALHRSRIDPERPSGRRSPALARRRRARQVKPIR